MLKSCSSAEYHKVDLHALLTHDKRLHLRSAPAANMPAVGDMRIAQTCMLTLAIKSSCHIDALRIREVALE